MDISKLSSVLPADIFTELNTILSTRVISKNQLCHLLANCDHESQGWEKFAENLNYKPDRLLEVFPKFFNGLADATAVVNAGVVAMADRIYGGRMGNIKGTSDAYNFRGSGPLMITGRYNFSLFDATVVDDITANPELLRTKYKLSSAFWFFDVNKIWVKAAGEDVASITAVRRLVNGGTIGLDDVKTLFVKYQVLISYCPRSKITAKVASGSIAQDASMNTFSSSILSMGHEQPASRDGPLMETLKNRRSLHRCLIHGVNMLIQILMMKAFLDYQAYATYS